jgi:hypothetical protein
MDRYAGRADDGAVANIPTAMKHADMFIQLNEGRLSRIRAASDNVWLHNH